MASSRVPRRPCIYCSTSTTRRTTRDEAAHEACESLALAYERFGRVLAAPGTERRLTVGTAFYGQGRARRVPVGGA